MKSGRIAGEIAGAEATEESVIALATGAAGGELLNEELVRARDAPA